MKEKNKNIFKGLGVGALACFGMLTFTGCSVDLTEDQVEKVMMVVDQSDKFMSETLNLLQKQNAKLSKEEGWDLYKLAHAKFITNQNGIRNNLKITSQYLEGDELVTYYYNDSNGIDLILETGSELGGNDRITFVVEEESTNKVYSYVQKGTEYEKALLGEGVVENYYPVIAINISFCTLENMTSCELLENGNYKLSFVQSEQGEDPENNITYCNYTTYEITKEGMFISQNVVIAEIDNNTDGTINEIFGGKMTYEYGIVQESDFADILAEAKDAEINS